MDVIPTWLARLPRLTGLSLGGCNLTGSIPPVLSNLTHLTVLILIYAQLTGPVPMFLGNFSELSWLALEGNQLSGLVPPALGNIPGLNSVQHATFTYNYWSVLERYKTHCTYISICLYIQQQILRTGDAPTRSMVDICRLLLTPNRDRRMSLTVGVISTRVPYRHGLLVP